MRVFSLLAILALLGCSERTNREAIRTVITKTAAARSDATHSNTERGKPVFHAKEFVASIENISTTDCPQEFRVAFLDYVQTWQRKTGKGSADALVALAQSHADTAHELSAARDTDEAQRRLEMAALKFGVSQ